ncbi:DNA topoisomerase IB [Ottowia thiooxydans]|uniref:DNA topoisomerase n=1 Tax=Ottowia thiooxydans TaxID=219182 RepID=A0ABV2QHE8_9BURK
MAKAGAGLLYVNDQMAGWRRLRRRGGFSYITSRGRVISAPHHLERVRKLAIPPAYEDVWICPDPRGHIQATGRDAKGRKQYRYHALWQEQRKEAKFDRMLQFGHSLPSIRRKIQADLARSDASLASVVAAVLRLLDRTGLRIGNEEYVVEGGSYGLSTLKSRHARIDGHRLTLDFKGKSGIKQHVEISDKRVVRKIHQCHELPGQGLFQFVDAQGQAHQVRSDHVNAYISSCCEGNFTAKDFRTWHASTYGMKLVLNALADSASADIAAMDAGLLVERVAERLGNTAAVCRKFYIHPEVLALCEKSPRPRLAKKVRKKAGLTLEESAFIDLLKSK